MITIRRHLNVINKKYMYYFYAQEFSFEKITFLKVKKLYQKEGDKIVRLFFHNLISDWIEENYQESDLFLSRLKKYIRRARLILNDEERDQILTLEERIFSALRHIKLLLVNFDLVKGEYAGAKFNDARIYKNNFLIDQGDLILTNKRIILVSKNNLSFYFDQTKKISGTDDGLLIKYQRNNFLIRIYDQPTLVNTFFNLYHKKVGKLV